MIGTGEQFLNQHHLRGLAIAFQQMCKDHISGSAKLTTTPNGYEFLMEAADSLKVEVKKIGSAYDIKLRVSDLDTFEEKSASADQATDYIISFLIYVFCPLVELLATKPKHFRKWIDKINPMFLALVVVNARTRENENVKEILRILPQQVHQTVDKLLRKAG